MGFLQEKAVEPLEENADDVSFFRCHNISWPSPCVKGGILPDEVPLSKCVDVLLVDDDVGGPREYQQHECRRFSFLAQGVPFVTYQNRHFLQDSLNVVFLESTAVLAVALHGHNLGEGIRPARFTFDLLVGVSSDTDVLCLLSGGLGHFPELFHLPHLEIHLVSLLVRPKLLLLVFSEILVVRALLLLLPLLQDRLGPFGFGGRRLQTCAFFHGIQNILQAGHPLLGETSEDSLDQAR